MLHIFVIVSNFAMLAFAVFALSMETPKGDEMIMVLLFIVVPLANLRYAFVIRKAASTKSEPSTFELFRLMIRAKLRTAADN
jgi:hypothetical protein